MLRKLLVKDVQRMLEWMHDPSVNCNFRTNFGAMTEREARNFIENSFNETNQNFAFTNADDDYLGTISLKNISIIDFSAEYAVVTRSDAQGTGCALSATMGLLRYAFQEMGLHRVYLNVLEKNIRANRFYAKCGFSFEGKFRDHLFLNNNFEHLNWYGILKDDFLELNNVQFDKFKEFLRPVTMEDAHTFVALTGRCAAPQFVCDGGGSTSDGFGNRSYSETLLIKDFNSPSLCHSQMLSLLAFWRNCDIILAVHSDCPPLEDAVS